MSTTTKTTAARSSPSAEEDEDVELLSDHTCSMRRALSFCQSLLSKLDVNDAGADDDDNIVCKFRQALDMSGDTAFHPSAVSKNALQASQQSVLQEKRHQAWKDFWRNPIIPVLAHNGTNATPRDFCRDFLLANRPCIIKNCGQEDEFDKVTKAWRHPNDSGKINTDWFRRHVGETTLVPVRQLNTTANGNLLDDQGRATECSIRMVPMRDWIDGLDRHENPNCYLKDWHLQQQLLLEHHVESSPLYTVLSCFEYDLLNGFLQRFTKGDYRFVYWGPKGSGTPIHSDVLHSFSWSYNVIGQKEWTFYRDDGDCTNSVCEQSVTLIQEAGEIVFVPCGWKHQVTNLRETLSINHNWITTANLDRTWDCILTELRDVDREWEAWNVANDSTSTSDSQNESGWDAKESMLRGCVGLDVTAFVFMCLVRICELLAEGGGNSACSENGAEWEEWFDMFRIYSVLKTIVSSNNVHVKERMRAVLGCRELGDRTMHLIRFVLGAIGKLVEQITMQ